MVRSALAAKTAACGSFLSRMYMTSQAREIQNAISWEGIFLGFKSPMSEVCALQAQNGLIIKNYTSSVFLVFVHPTSLASLAKMDGARSKVKVDLDSLVNYLSCSLSHKMGWGDVLRSKIRFPWN